MTVWIASEIVDLILSIDKEEKADDHIETKAYTTMINWPNAHVIFKTDNLGPNAVGHEVDHLSHFLMRAIGVKETDESDEAYAYMNGWLMNKVLCIIVDAGFKLETPKKRRIAKKKVRKSLTRRK